MDWLMHQPFWLQAFFATLFTYLMTAAGASFVFISKKCSEKILNLMQGTAAGIMIAASFFSLLLPAKERLEGVSASWIAACILAIGFAAGGAFILLSNAGMAKLKIFSEDKKRSGALTCFAITLHNIPEGFAVGVAFGSLTGEYSAWISAVNACGRYRHTEFSGRIMCLSAFAQTGI